MAGRGAKVLRLERDGESRREQWSACMTVMTARYVGMTAPHRAPATSRAAQLVCAHARGVARKTAKVFAWQPRPPPPPLRTPPSGAMSASVVGKIQDIEAELARTQINKQTMGHLCLLRAKLAKYKRELLEPAKGGGGGPGDGFDVRATGDARVGFVGFPSVGKSTLLTSLTDVYSEAASYEFTTLTCVPGIKHHRGAKIQLLDLPGIIEGAKDGKGRGRQVIAVARTCSCIIVVLDALKPLQHKLIIQAELEGVGIRLNKKPPAITVKKKERGGLNLSTSCKLTHMDDDSVAAILKECASAATHARTRAQHDGADMEHVMPQVPDRLG